MMDFNGKNYEEMEDTPTLEEQQRIEEIQIATFIPVKKETPTSTSIWSIFTSLFGGGLNTPEVGHLVGSSAVGATQIAVPRFDLQKFLYLEKSVIINNISGKNAYVLISSNPIKIVKAVGLGAGAPGIEGNINIEFENKGDYEVQKINILNNTSSRCCLDNTKFRCTLFLNIDGEWKKTWENRRFDGRRFNINILEKHVEAALKKDDIPDF